MWLKERESKLVGLESELSETITALRKMTVDGEDVRRKLVVELEGRAIAEAQVPLDWFLHWTATHSVTL